MPNKAHPSLDHHRDDNEGEENALTLSSAAVPWHQSDIVYISLDRDWNTGIFHHRIESRQLQDPMDVLSGKHDDAQHFRC